MQNMRRVALFCARVRDDLGKLSNGTAAQRVPQGCDKGSPRLNKVPQGFQKCSARFKVRRAPAAEKPSEQ